MNTYTYEQITVGHTETFDAAVTEEMMKSFHELTGDCNPLHLDGDFAKKRGFDGKVVYGMLTASLLSTLAGVYLPGLNSIIYETNLKFAAPVYVGDMLTVKGEVTSKNESFKILELKVTISKSDGTKVLRGKMKIGTKGVSAD